MRTSLLLLLSLMFAPGCSSQDNDVVVLTEQGLVDDLLFLKEKIETTHPNPFHLTTETAFDSTIQHVLDNRGRYNVDELFVQMLAITASIGDGHTNLRPFSYYNPYPIRFYWLQDHIYVSGTLEAHRSHLGSVLIAIDGTPIEEASRRVFNIIPGHESAGFSRDWATYYFRVSQILYGLGISPSREAVVFTLEDATGNRTDLTLTIDPSNETAEIVRPYDKTPHFHDTRENGLWFSELDHNLIYLHFSGYPGDKVFRSVARDLNKHLDEADDVIVLIDLRRNGGGNFNKGRKFIAMIEETILRQEIPVYVATSSATYSAAVANAIDFRDRLNATLVGEVTGGRPNGYQENSAFVLPKTRIPGSVSSAYYAFQEADTPGVYPDIEIDYTWEIFAGGYDPVLDYLYQKVTQ